MTFKTEADEGGPFKVSLWLLPPADVDDRLQSEIDRLATLRPNASGITFRPHVTLVGGITAMDATRVEGMVRRLRDGLRGFGTVHCAFDAQLDFATDPDHGDEAVWNQAAAAILQTNTTTPAFLRLVRRTRTLLDLPDPDADCLLFPPPIRRPHMSLYYGRTGVPSEADVTMRPIPAFTADRVALWKTSPSRNEQDVSQWQELAVISLR